MTEIGTVTKVGRIVFLWGWPCPCPKGLGFKRPKKNFLDTLRTPKRCDMWTRSM